MADPNIEQLPSFSLTDNLFAHYSAEQGVKLILNIVEKYGVQAIHLLNQLSPTTIQRIFCEAQNVSDLSKINPHATIIVLEKLGIAKLREMFNTADVIIALLATANDLKAKGVQNIDETIIPIVMFWLDIDTNDQFENQKELLGQVCAKSDFPQPDNNNPTSFLKCK